MRYAQFNVPLTAVHAVDEETDFNQPLNLHIAVRILGAEHVHLVPAQTGLPEPVDVQPAGSGIENVPEK
jgi:hypothetical protein